MGEKNKQTAALRLSFKRHPFAFLRSCDEGVKMSLMDDNG